MRLTIAAAALLALSAAPAFAAGDPAFGSWLTQDGMGKVDVGPCKADASRACGTISWLKDPVGHPSKDVNNPDPAQRSRPLVGLTIVRNMKGDGPGRWSGGEIYDPKSGKTYKSKMHTVSAGKLQVEGCILMVCQGQTWTRAD